MNWYFERSFSYPTSLPISHEHSISIHNVTWKDAGFYFCYGFASFFFLTVMDYRVYSKDTDVLHDVVYLLIKKFLN